MNAKKQSQKTLQEPPPRTCLFFAHKREQGIFLEIISKGFTVGKKVFSSKTILFLFAKTIFVIEKKLFFSKTTVNPCQKKL